MRKLIAPAYFARKAKKRTTKKKACTKGVCPVMNLLSLQAFHFSDLVAISLELGGLRILDVFIRDV